MAAIHGSISEFCLEKENWTSYIEQLHHYFIANDVVAEEKKPAILSACGAATFKLVRIPVSSAEIETTSFSEIVQVLKDHFDPVPSAIMQRFKFNSRIRAAGESVSKYIAALRSLAEHCQYKDTLKEMLRDRLVCGINHDGIQQRLLAEKGLNEKALELALVIESAEKDTKEMKIANGKPFPARDVYQFHTHPKPTKEKKKVFIPKKIVL